MRVIHSRVYIEDVRNDIRKWLKKVKLFDCTTKIETSFVEYSLENAFETYKKTNSALELFKFIDQDVETGKTKELGFLLLIYGDTIFGYRSAEIIMLCIPEKIKNKMYIGDSLTTAVVDFLYEVNNEVSPNDKRYQIHFLYTKSSEQGYNFYKEIGFKIFDVEQCSMINLGIKEGFYPLDVNDFEKHINSQIKRKTKKYGSTLKGTIQTECPYRYNSFYPNITPFIYMYVNI